MNSKATICPALAALSVTVFDDEATIHAIVTREMLEHVFGDLGKGQHHLLTAYSEHSAAICALILERYRTTGKDPVLLHADGDEAAAVAPRPDQAAASTRA